MTPTAERADFVIGPRLELERADVPHIMDGRIPAPYTNYTPAVLATEDDLLSEWEVFAGIAARNRTQIVLPGGPIPHRDGALLEGLDDDDMLDLVYARSRMPMAELREHRGSIHPDRRITVVAGDPQADARFCVAPEDVTAELAAVRQETSACEVLGDFDPERYRFRLVSRRMKHVLNSLGRELPGLAPVGTYLHPSDLEALGVVSGDLVRIESPFGVIVGVAETAEDVKPGVVSMSHAWGGSSTSSDVRGQGVATNRLVATHQGFDPITGMAVQSAIPVAVTAEG
jgi:anaerobic selenocysteine-containing dehydrogenase